MTGELVAEKQAARAELRALWRALPAHELASVSDGVVRQLQSLPEWKAATRILLYSPMPVEIDISTLATEALHATKTVCVPRTDWSAGLLHPVVVTDWSDADRGKRDPSRPLVPVPVESAERLDPRSLDLVIVPGLGFDTRGNRLGRGAGFYDRFLLENSLGARACGLIPERMLRQKIPAGAMDAPVSMIVTESRVIRI
ncbi:MAG: 5-formyltetrahydrofolate cyclo-ligase [Phycisphaeraceae bacterium]|nr:5-formyltetrahydrofolate cyclo-ligase [Phycisphaeraceae bacterium]